MLNNNYFYFSTSRKYISIFGSLFNNLYINRTNSNGEVTQIINVPISYGQKEKMMTRMIQDPDISKQASIILPRMSFFLDGIDYDTKRKNNSLCRIFYSDPNNKSVRYQYDGVPYNYYFSLYIYVKNAEDGTKIIEQILPFFKPEFTIRAFMLDGQDSQDVSIEIDEISHENNDTNDFKDNPVLVWTLRFTLRGMLFGPIRTGVPTISNLTVSTSFGSVDSNTLVANIHSFGLTPNVYSNGVIISTPSQTINITPAVDANNNPIVDWDQIITTIG